MSEDANTQWRRDIEPSISRTADRVVISKDFDFEAAHHLPYHDGKCKRPHGHSYKLRVSLIGDIAEVDPDNPASGMVIDFAEMKSRMSDVMTERLDHHDLNDFDQIGLSYPTAENILIWIVGMLKDRFGDMLYEVTLWETATCSATWKKHLHG